MLEGYFLGFFVGIVVGMQAVYHQIKKGNPRILAKIRKLLLEQERR